MQPSSQKPAWLFPFLISASVLALIILTYAAANYFVHRMDYVNSDFFTLWLGGKLVSKGLDPYNTQVWLAGHDIYQAAWRPNPTYVYPLPMAVLFVPLAMLPLDQAFTLWFFLSIWALIISVLLLLQMMKMPGIYHLVLPLLAGAILFRPAIVTLRNGQLGAVLLLALTLAVFFMQKERWLAGGAVIGLLILKPQLGFPLLLLLGIWLLIHKRWKVLLGMGVTGIVLLLIGLIIQPGWPVAFLSAGIQKFYATFGYAPTIWGVVGELCKHQYACNLSYGSILTAIFILCVFWLLMRKKTSPPIYSVSILIPVALLITPYTWAYDQILLVIPITYTAVRLLERQTPYLLTATWFLVIDIAALALLALAVKNEVDVWSAAIPFACLLFVWRLGSSPLHKKSPIRPQF